MTKADVRTWLEDFRRRTGHKNAPGCVVCATLNMLLAELEGKQVRIIDGVVIHGPEA